MRQAQHSRDRVGAGLLSVVLVSALASLRADPPPAPPQRAPGRSPVSEIDTGRAIAALLAHPAVEMVFLPRRGLYEAHSRTGLLKFLRVPGDGGWTFERIDQKDADPLARQSERSLATSAGIEAAARNGAVPPEAVSYPRAFERIAALFDAPDAPDLMVELVPAASDVRERSAGTHGALNGLASRGVLAFSGAGIKKGALDGAASGVDVAPTLASLLGVPAGRGLDATGRPRDGLFLKRQDGRVLEEILSGTRAERAVLLIVDGLSHVELSRAFEEKPGALPALRALWLQGAPYRLGMIVNYPSNTAPSQGTLVTGAWSGHHGLVDNCFMRRSSRTVLDIFSPEVLTGEGLSDGVETLHEALHRAFGRWDPARPGGAFTLCLTASAGRGADAGLWDLASRAGPLAGCPRPASFRAPPSDPLLPAAVQKSDDGVLEAFAKAFVGRRPDGVPCAPLPRFTVASLRAVDEASHIAGPQSALALRALEQTDRRVAALLEVVRQAGALSTTVFVLASDHGTVSAGPREKADLAAVLDATGIPYRLTGNGVYLLRGSQDGPPVRCEGELAVFVVRPEGGSLVSAGSGVVKVKLSRCVAEARDIAIDLFRGGEPVPGEVLYAPGETEARFRPFELLEPGARYEVRVRSGHAAASARFRVRSEARAARPPAGTIPLAIESFDSPGSLAALLNGLAGTLGALEVDLSGRGPAPVRLAGRQFRWGPAPAAVTFLTLPVPLREVIVSGLLSADGRGVEFALFTAVADLEEVSRALGKDVGILCASPALLGACGTGRLVRVAGRLAAPGRPSTFPRPPAASP